MTIFLLLLLSTTCWVWFPTVSANPKTFMASGDEEPNYVGVAEYYDNRKCVVTITMDDLIYNCSEWQNSLSMFTAKKLYHTAGIITSHSSVADDWDFIQYWVNQGYTEAGSHSRNHVHPPYVGEENGRRKISYEWQINGSKQDILGNLTLPHWWRYGDKEYVYAWIEPYGQSDETVRQWLGKCHYLIDRNVDLFIFHFSTWNSKDKLFNRIGYSDEMGEDIDVWSLNWNFDYAYKKGKIYQLMVHPSLVDWSKGSYADQHTDYISNRTDVWYVPFGLLYLYRWIYDQNIVNVTSTDSGQNKIFRIDISSVNHQNYGVSYPITYVFDIPLSWKSGHVYYRYRETDPWTLMTKKASNDFFNGIDASRFDFIQHKAYVSVGFSELSDTIYLQLRNSPQRNPLQGDTNNDGTIYVVDLAMLWKSWFKRVKDLRYDSRCDFNANGFVDVADLAVLGANWARTLRKLLLFLA